MLSAGVEKSALLSHIKTNSIELEHEKEWKLAKILLKLPDVIVKLAQDLYPHPLCEFLYEVKYTVTFVIYYKGKTYIIHFMSECLIIGLS